MKPAEHTAIAVDNKQQLALLAQYAQQLYGAGQIPGPIPPALMPILSQVGMGNQGNKLFNPHQHHSQVCIYLPLVICLFI